MKCEKCGNDYPSEYYFSAPNVCSSCYGKLSEKERQQLNEQMFSQMSGFDFSNRVGFGYRLGAYLLDIVFVFILMVIAFYFTGDLEAYFSSFSLMFSDPVAYQEIQFQVLPITIFISVVYNSLDVFLAATPGKIILNLQIAGREGTKAQISDLVFRFMFKNISSILSVIFIFTNIEIFHTIGGLLGLVVLIGCFFVLSKKRQAFHDIFAKTAVFKRSYLSQLESQES